MRNRPRLVFILSLLPCFTFLQAQKIDSTFTGTDRLLAEEVSFPVINRLEKNDFQTRKALPSLNRLTEAYLLSLDFVNAQKLLYKADSLLTRESPVERAYHHSNWSRYTYEQADYTSSISYALTSIQLLTGLKVGSIHAELLHYETVLQLGKSYLQLRRMKEAKSQFDMAIGFFKKDSARYPIKLAQTYFSLGLWSKVSNELSEAERFYLRAISLLESSTYERYYDLGRCFNNLASVYSEQGNYGLAKSNYLKALELKKKHGTDSLSLAITYNNLGRFYTDYGNNFKAKDCFKNSIALLDQRNARHRERIPEFLNNYGSLLFEIDEQDEAEKCFRRGLDILKEDHASSERQLAPYLSLAGLQLVMKKMKEADDLLTKAEPLLTDKVAARNVALWHLRKANLLAMRKELPEAEEEYGKAISASGSSNTLLSSEIYQELGQLYMMKKSWREALEATRESHRIIEVSMSTAHPKLCTTYNMLGEIYMGLKIPDSAFYYINKSMELNKAEHPVENIHGLQAIDPFELISSQYLASKLFYEQYMVTGKLSQLKLSESFVALGLRAIDARRKSLAIANDQLTFDERISLLFERAMETYLALKKENGEFSFDKVFYASELSKSQSLGQALRESNLQSFSNVPETLRKEEEILREEILTIDLQTLKELKWGDDANPDIINEYQQELNLANKQYQSLQDSIRLNLPGYYQLKYNKTLVTPADIRKDILTKHPHAALVEFSTGDSALYVQIITNKTEAFYRIENAPEVRNRIIAFRNQIKSGLNIELYENANWLYQRIFGDAEKILAGEAIRQLIIVPDQILCYLPFEALITNLSKREYLINDYDISYAYSSTLLWQKYMDAGKSKQSRSFIGLAPQFESNETSRLSDTREEGIADRFQFQPLSGNTSEVDLISIGMEKNKVKSSVLEGQDATEASFRKLNLRNYDYVHFATHGFVDMDRPQYSGVAFSRNKNAGSFDDILFTNEVYEMQFDARLVCLSSCDSGIGKIYRGEGMIGLAQSFLFAGARNLAVSLWKVDDTATRDLMVQFYSGLDNKSLSAALTSAKRKMASSKKFNHPYYWSSFILIGI